MIFQYGFGVYHTGLLERNTVTNLPNLIVAFSPAPWRSMKTSGTMTREQRGSDAMSFFIFCWFKAWVSGNGFGVQGLGSTGLCVCGLGLFIAFWVWELSCVSSKSWGWQHSMMRATGLATTGEKTVSISSCNKLSFMCAYHYIHANTNNLRTKRPLI